MPLSSSSVGPTTATPPDAAAIVFSVSLGAVVPPICTRQFAASNSSPVCVFGARDPLAAVKNPSEHVVSAASAATVTVAALPVIDPAMAFVHSRSVNHPFVTRAPVVAIDPVIAIEFAASASVPDDVIAPHPSVPIPVTFEEASMLMAFSDRVPVVSMSNPLAEISTLMSSVPARRTRK